MDPRFDHLDQLRQQLLDAALARAAFEGWTPAMLARAEADAGLPAGTAELVCPEGVVDLIDFWGLRADEATAEALSGLDPEAIKIRARVRAGVLARLYAIGAGDREAARRAFARLALPDAAPRGAAMLWRAADTIWRGIGDTSTDANFYSKRAILSGVIASTFTVWLEGGEQGEAEAFLDRRIENVMQFEKAKAKVREATAKWPDPAGVLARLRYGR
jgi:ubiquinone biosynthesis protein COQ9